MSPHTDSPLFSDLVERAMRTAAIHHRGQSRKASDLPYITHPAAMAVILMKAGFDDDAILAAALLHDTIEDTDYSQAELAEEFPAEVAAIVAALSEQKTDESGQKRPWRDRKQDHIDEVAHASTAARAVVLADKLHNLGTMLYDQRSGQDIWSRFNAGREDVLWYHRTMVDTAAADDDPRLRQLAAACHAVIEELAQP